MEAFLLQLPALLGVLIGALASYLAGQAAERSRWRRQQSVRWDEHRITTYTRYAHAVKKVIAVSVRLAAERGLASDDSALTPDYEVSDLAAAEEERTIMWEAVLMVGSERVVLAGRQWHQSVFQLMHLACGRPSDLSWADAVAATGRARQRFYEAARGDIGIAAGSEPDAYEWQMSRWMRDRPAEPADGPAEIAPRQRPE